MSLFSRKGIGRAKTACSRRTGTRVANRERIDISRPCSFTIEFVNTSLPNPSAAVAALGVSAVVAQSVLLREAMTAMGGSEMAWGIVMAMWLAGVGIGARLGVRVGSTSAATRLPVIAVVLGGLGVLLFRAAPALLHTAPGETLTTWHAIWFWALAVVPCAACAGVAFPILAGALGPGGPGRAYAIEAAGALVGGLAFSFLLAPLGAAATLLIVLASIIGLLLWRRSPVIAIVAMVGIAAVAVPAESSLAVAGWRWSERPGELGAWAETRSKRLEASTGPPVTLYVDGRLAATVPDPYTTAPRANLKMLLHPDPKRVFAVGVATDGAVETIARWRPSDLLVVEDDPAVIPLLENWYGPDFAKALQGPWIRLPKGDSVTALSTATKLDLILLDDGDPTTLRGNRTRTLEYFRRCRNALDTDGILVVETGVTDTYLGGEAGRLLATLAATLARVFPRVTAIPGERVLLVAGADQASVAIDADILEQRWLQRGELADSMPAAMIRLLIDPARQATLEDWLQTAVAPANTIVRPEAVVHAAALHEARSRASLARLVSDPERTGRKAVTGLASVVAAALLLAAVVRQPRLLAVGTAAVVGGTSIGWWILLLAMWQATRGSVFSEVGALTGLFMAGVAIGGWIGLRFETSRMVLPVILGCGVLLSLAIASTLPIHIPVVLVPLLLLVGGGLTGAAFPVLGRSAANGNPRRGAGLAFAADELGAALAALTIGTVAIPWFGMTATSLGLAAIGLAAIPGGMSRLGNRG
jgi:spermidine synthase